MKYIFQWETRKGDKVGVSDGILVGYSGSVESLKEIMATVDLKIASE